MKISVCIDALFYGKDFFESMERIKQININSFEFWCWWDKDIEKIKQVKQRLNLNLVGCCTKFISLVDPQKRSEYIHGLEESIIAANNLDCKMLITQVGNDLGNSRYKQRQSIIDGLKMCVPMLEKNGIMLVFEPLNTLVDHAGYYLYSSEEAFEIVDSVDSPHVKVLYDVYHQQIMEGNILSRLTENIDKIGHIHAAGNPGRHELYKGEINYMEIIKAIDSTTYIGYLGLEYFPEEDPIERIQKLTRK